MGMSMSEQSDMAIELEAEDMMGTHDPIAYTYDADLHCVDCATARFGVAKGHPWLPESARDSEGNEIGAVAPWDEWWNADGECETLTCGDCHGTLDIAHASECVENDGEEPCTVSN